MIADPGDLIATIGYGMLPVLIVQIETHRLRGAPRGTCLQANLNHRDLRLRDTDCMHVQGSFLHTVREKGIR